MVRNFFSKIYGREINGINQGSYLKSINTMQPDMLHNSNNVNKINIDQNKEMILNLITIFRLTMTVCTM